MTAIQSGLVIMESRPRETPCSKVTRIAFLQLPMEIRMMIYQHLFKSTRAVAASRVVAAESNLFLNRFNSYGHVRGIIVKGIKEICSFPGATLFRTCRRIHQEATQVLYGQNRFLFDDQAFFNVRLDRPLAYGQLLGGSFIPDCPLTEMVDFLRKIGESNRRSIKCVKIVFYTDIFTTFSNEIDADEEVKTAYCGGAVVTIDALRYLSEQCQIKSLSLRFLGQYHGITSFSIWFAAEARQSEALGRFCTLQRFRCHLGQGAEEIRRLSEVPDEESLGSEIFVEYQLENAYNAAKLRYRKLKRALKAAYRNSK